jgi:hypothetical protein
LVAIGLLCACLGGLGAAFAWTSVSTAHPVVVVQRALVEGDVVSVGDFGVADVSVPAGVATMPGDAIAGLIGQQALVDMPLGTLVGPSSVGTIEVVSGDAVVGLDLAPGFAPVGTLPYGTRVILLQVPQDQSNAPATPWTAPAKVVKASTVSTDGSSLVDVSLPQDAALTAAALAARGELVVLRMGG